MKQLLPIFVLLLTVSALRAQRVVIKDSGSYSYYNGIYQSRGTNSDVGTHTTNRFCKDSVIQSREIRILYSYNTLQQVTEVINQSKYRDADSFTSKFRTTYAYTPAGKYDTLTLSSSGLAEGVFFDNTQFRYIYDKNNFLLKQVQYSWNTIINSWAYQGESIYFNNSSGKPDSIYYYGSYDTSITTYTYYINSRTYQVSNYTLHNGSRKLDFISTNYHDSTNYMQRDSSVSQEYAPNSDSLYISGIYSYTHYLNIDGTEKQTSIYSYNSNGITSSTNRNGIYYFYGDCFSVLPVSFISFAAQKQNSNAILNWQTANETNTSSFQIQRSIDGVHFTTVGSVKASGNSSHETYTFTDVNALLLNTSKLYYRLAEQDNNGTINYSKTVTLDITAGKLSVYVSPNPVTGSINVYAVTTMGAAQIIVSDMKGNIVYSGKQNIVAGNKVSIDASGFAKGIYLVTIQSISYKQQLKIVKE